MAVVVFLWGKDVFLGVSIEYVLESFAKLDEAIRLISEEVGLSFEVRVDQPDCKMYRCTDKAKRVRIIAKLVKVLK